ncbi:MAG: 2-hydroxyacyl-CoA dehydratase [Euryarchaeota archaeon]|nr:2-hydroxyacyl-CoA dehydratase [Euryarchaeota archaeon]MDE1880490.1 2-hydroxyacyl-CoA dehydratase [Euryarchaeota archaeon]
MAGSSSTPAPGPAVPSLTGAASSPGFLHDAREQQRQMVDRYYAELDQAEKEKRPVAYMLVGGNLTEIVRSFGYEVVFPEIVALNCAIKHKSLDYILQAEAQGYGLDVCGYVKNDLGLQALGGNTPFGHIPKPDLLVCSFSGCYVYIKWWEALAETLNAPLFNFDVPYQRTEKPLKEDIEYMVAQLWDFIHLLEKRTGRSFDMAELKRVLERSRRAEELWVKYLEAGKHRPSPIEAYFEAVFYMFPINVLRGTDQAVRFYETVNAEVETRVKDGTYPVPEEKVRLVVEGVPPYTNYRTFWDFFRKWGAVSVAATYPKVGGLFDMGFYHDPSRPLESIAEYSLGAYVNQNWPLRRQLIRQYIKDYQADAVVIHGIKSCRSFTAGQGDLRDWLIHETGTPTLYLESDHEDPRYFAPAQIKNRMDAFFESLDQRRSSAAATPGRSTP